ncbi:hypothetical protein, partial [Anaeromassilibacillus sp. An200]|uniref:hypothetical protein n=1 Tax=Anaeromassilibacillus sp. An200 TaxID=1965587 RepID=UPI0019D21B24
MKQSFERKKPEIFDEKRSCDRKKGARDPKKKQDGTKFTLRKKAKAALETCRSFPLSTRISRSFLFQFGRKCGIIIEWPCDKFRFSGWVLSASLCRAVTPTHGIIATWLAPVRGLKHNFAGFARKITLQQ